MPVTPEALLHTSEVLLNAAQDEAGVRAAVSRIYYSAYHKSLQCANLPKDRPGSSISVHRNLIDNYKNDAKNLHRQAVGDILEGLRKHRVIADYRLNVPVSALSAQNDLAQAKKLFERLAALGTAS